jgi:hypothetical protein
MTIKRNQQKETLPESPSVHDKTLLLKNLHINIIHGYDEDTVLGFKYRTKLGFSPVSFHTSGHVIGEAGKKKKPLSWRRKTALNAYTMKTNSRQEAPTSIEDQKF